MEAFSHVTFAAKSDIGRKRKNNEDAFGAFPSHGVYCVADGMGGGDDGEVASAATVSAVENFVKSHPLPASAAFSADSMIAGIRSAVKGASKWIYDRAVSRNLKGCGSTFVGVCLDPARPGEATALHAGDSRLYRIRGRGIQQITKDHSAAELIGAKNESEINPMFRGMILRAVGIQPTVEVDATPLPLKEGDCILICSDGLSRMVPDKKMVSIVRESATPDAAVEALVAAANEAGGIDNVTVVLVAVGKLPPPLPVVDIPMAAEGSDAPTIVSRTDDSFTSRDSDSSPLFEMQTDESGGGDAVSFATETSTSSTLTGATADTADKASSEAALIGSGWKAMQEAIEDEAAQRRSSSRKKAIVAAVVVALVAAALFAVFGGKSGKKSEAEEVAVDQKAVEEAARKAAEDAARKIKEESEAQIAAMQRQIAEVNRSAAEAKLKAEEERLKVEEAKRRAEQAMREAEEKARREKEEEARIAAQKEQQRKLEEQRAAIKKQQEEMEKQRKAMEEQQLALKKRQEEMERLRKAEEAARKAAEEAMRKEREEAERRKREAEAARKAAEEAMRKEREAGLQKSLSMFEEVCSEETAVQFVRKLKEFKLENVSQEFLDNLCVKFKPLWKDIGNTREEKLAAAVDLTHDVKHIAAELVVYARMTLENAREDARSGPFKKEKDRLEKECTVAKMEKFLENARILEGGDPSDPKVQSACATMIYSIPQWF